MWYNQVYTENTKSKRKTLSCFATSKFHVRNSCVFLKPERREASFFPRKTVFGVACIACCTN